MPSRRQVDLQSLSLFMKGDNELGEIVKRKVNLFEDAVVHNAEIYRHHG